jgi:hypothetical protein
METNFEKIKQIIANSTISEADQIEFIESCEGVIDDQLELLVDLFIESPEWIGKVIENLKEKKDAAHQRNMKSWEDVISSEVSYLESENKLQELRLSSSLSF